MTPIRFHLEEHLNPAIADGLKRLGIDVTTTMEAGLLGAADREHLAFALAEGHVVFTNDSDFLNRHDAGEAHAGIVYCRQGLHNLREILRGLALIPACLSADQMHQTLEFVSMFRQVPWVELAA